MFYISAFFEARWEEYYDKLLAVSKDNDWSGCCVFFLNAVKAQAGDNQSKATAILKLYDKMKVRVCEQSILTPLGAPILWLKALRPKRSANQSRAKSCTKPCTKTAYNRI